MKVHLPGEGESMSTMAVPGEDETIHFEVGAMQFPSVTQITSTRIALGMEVYLTGVH